MKQPSQPFPVTNFKQAYCKTTNHTNAYCLKVVSGDTIRQCTITAECIHSELCGEY